MNAKSINFFSREDYDKVFRKSDSYHSLSVVKCSVSSLDRFCTEIYQKDTDDVLTEIRGIMQNPNNVIVMIFLDKFSSFLQNEEKSSSSIKAYVDFAKKYLRQCGGIRISTEDMQDYVTIPIDEEGNDDLEPLTTEELLQILDNIPNQRRKVFFMVLKDAGYRIGETLQLKKKYFDLFRFLQLYTFQRVTKGKKRKRIQRLTNETVKTLKPVLAKLKDDDYLSQSNYGNDPKHGYKTERDVFVRVLK